MAGAKCSSFEHVRAGKAEKTNLKHINLNLVRIKTKYLATRIGLLQAVSPPARVKAVKYSVAGVIVELLERSSVTP